MPKLKIHPLPAGVLLVCLLIGVVFMYKDLNPPPVALAPAADTTAQKAYVFDGTDTIAEQKRKAKRDSAYVLLNQMRKESDEMSEVAFYHAPTSTKYFNRNEVRAYIGITGDVSALRFRVQYAGDDWLFIQKYVFKCDTSIITYYKTADKTEVLDGGQIAEWFDVSVGMEELGLLRAIAGAKTVKLRLEGKQFYKDRTLNKKEIAAMAQVLKAWDALN